MPVCAELVEGNRFVIYLEKSTSWVQIPPLAPFLWTLSIMAITSGFGPENVGSIPAGSANLVDWCNWQHR